MKKTATIGLVALLAIAFSADDSSAQSLGFKGIGGRLGYVDAQFIDGTILFGAHAHLGEIIENLVLIPSIDYFSKSSVDFLSINGNVRYYFPSGSKVDFFAGGGLAIVRVSVPGVSTPFGSTGGASSTEIGLNLKGGAEMPLSDKLMGTAELIYVTEGEQIKIMAGVTYMLGE